ncbi:hypothetical protein VB618_18365 [Microvirga sp. CF3062]|uniref:hypothetical protein n=1 Tax=Microvirga sp. CF3062 TaxID=3110182 RepID=UPI002E766350|nr:hypothetical protein [Microvirga sp. CF3062]MEE1658166.1 hypothetical protein [Microvirga sp. CF3062]
MKEQRSSGSLLDRKIRLRKRDADSRCDKARTQYAVESSNAFNRIFDKIANKQLSRAQGAIGPRPSSQNGEDGSPFQLGLIEIFLRSFLLWRNRLPGCSLSLNRLFSREIPTVFKETQLHQEFLDLEHHMRLLDRKLADALHRIRHGSSSESVEQARQDEKQLLYELDRLMTRMRAIEGQLLQIQKSATRH